MNTRQLDLANLSDEEAHLLHDFLLFDESETEKYKKVKLFIPGFLYETENFSFMCNEIFVRTKEKKGSREYFYTVYSNNNCIGTGGFGRVYLVLGKLEHIDGKMTYKEEKCQVIKKTIHHQYAKLEYELAKKLPDTESKKTTSVYFVHNVYPGFTLPRLSFNVMRKLPGEDFIDTIFDFPYTILQRIHLSINALMDLKRLYRAGILQRDIKLENMRVDHSNMSMRIFDFGLGREIANPDYKQTGSYGWRSPEMEARPQIADASSDVYSMGIVLRVLFADKRAEDDIALACTNAHSICNKRRNQYEQNRDYSLHIKPEMIKQWKQECPSVDIQLLKNILQHLTTSRPENRLSIDNAISQFMSLGMKIAFAHNDAVFISLLLNNGAIPDYEAFTKASDAKQWNSVFAFVRANPDSVNNPVCADAYDDALLRAVRNRQSVLSEELLQKGALVSYGINGWSALHFAIDQGDDALVQRLFDTGMNPTLLFSNGLGSLQFAFEKRSPVAIVLLLVWGEKPDYAALTKAADDREWECVLAFVKANQETGKNSAACAKAYGEVLSKTDPLQIELIETLIEKGAPMTFVSANDKYVHCHAVHFRPASRQPKPRKLNPTHIPIQSQGM